MSAHMHTPGPWHVAISDHGRWSAIIEDATGDLLIADLLSADNPRSNAPLIAAAPKLLASLRELHDWMREHASAAESAEMLTRSHNAIAEAEANL